METLPPSVQTAFTEFLLFLPDLITALVVFVATFVIASWVNKLILNALEVKDVEPQIAELLAKIARWSVIVLGTITALQQVNFDVAAFIAGLGIMGLALGFALQDVTQNFVAGVLLLVQQPFEIGDLIEVDDHTGWVREVDLRATRLRTLDGLDVLIPNSSVFTSAITNHTTEPLQRVALGVGVAYSSDLDRAAEVALEAINQLPFVLKEPAPPDVNYRGFGGSSIDFNVYYWHNNLEYRPRVAIDAGVRAIKKAFDEAGIEIPFPIRTVHLERE